MKYPNGFLAVSHTGVTYYLSANTLAEREEWVLHIKTALECNFANTDLLPYKPSKAFHRQPESTKSNTCHRTGHHFGSISPCVCKCCGNVFMPDAMTDYMPVLQVGIELSERICSYCKNAQLIVLWFKSANYMHAMRLHERSSYVSQSILKYKSTFRLKRNKSSRLEMAAKMLDDKMISSQEFEELRKVDEVFNRDWTLEESERLRDALDMLENDLHTILEMLTNPKSTETGGIRSYYELIRKVLELADEDADLIDFYWPQLLHIHLRTAKNMTWDTLAKVDLLQQCILVVSLKYPLLAIKACWALLSSVQDFADKKIMPSQYAACAALLLQIDALQTGQPLALCDPPSSSSSSLIPYSSSPFGTSTSVHSSVMSSFITAAEHQRKELRAEIRVTMRCRRFLLKQQDEDDLERARTKPRVSYDETTISKSIAQSSPTATPSPTDKQHVVDSSPRERDASVTSLVRSRSARAGSTGRLTLAQMMRLVGEEVPPSTPRGMMHYPTLSAEALKSVQMSNKSTSPNQEPLFVVPPYASGDASFDLNHQIDWVRCLTDAVDRLRHMERHLRTEKFREFAEALNQRGHLGYDPSTNAAEPMYKLAHVFVEHCRVFRTKARAPSMLVYQVTRVDEYVEDVSLMSTSSDHGFTIDGGMIVNRHISRAVSSPQRSEDVESIIESGVSKALAELTNRKDSKDASLSAPTALFPESGRDLEVDAVGGLDRSSLTSKSSININALIDKKMVFTQRLSMKYQRMPGQMSRLAPHKKSTNHLPAHAYATTVSPASLPTSLKVLPTAMGPPRLSPVPTGAVSSSAKVEPSTNKGVVGVSAVRMEEERGRSPISLDELVRGRSMYLSSSMSSTGSIESSSQENLAAGVGTGIDIEKDSVPECGIVVGAEGQVGIDVPVAVPCGEGGDEGGNGVVEYSGQGHEYEQALQVEEGVSVPVGRGENGEVYMSSRDGSAFVANDGAHVGTLSNGEGEGEWVCVDNRDVVDDEVNFVNDLEVMDEEPVGPGVRDALITKRVQASAKELLEAGKITEAEYKLLMRGNAKYREMTVNEESVAAANRLHKNFGESWEMVKKRLLGPLYEPIGGGGVRGDESLVGTAATDEIVPDGAGDGVMTSRHLSLSSVDGNQSALRWPLHDVRSVIIKSNDDLRQEMCCMQLIELCMEIFRDANLSNCLWLKPYRIISTGPSTGNAIVMLGAYVR